MTPVHRLLLPSLLFAATSAHAEEFALYVSPGFLQSWTWGDAGWTPASSKVFTWVRS